LIVPRSLGDQAMGASSSGLHGTVLTRSSIFAGLLADHLALCGDACLPSAWSRLTT
jgi:hypothetical protein